MSQSSLDIVYSNLITSQVLNNCNIGIGFPNTMYIFLYNASSGNSTGSTDTGYTWPDTNWHHICLTIQPSGTNTWTLYVDNIKQNINFSLFFS